MGIDRLQPIRLINCFLKPTTFHATREFGWVLTDTTKNCRTHLPESLLLAKAPQKQTQTKNCRTHLPKSLLQRPLRNKRKRRIATPTSPRACRKGPAQTDSNEELPHLPPREPVAKALQQQTCKRRIATPTSPRACRKSRSATNTNEELLHPPPREPAVANAKEELPDPPPRDPVVKASQKQTQTKNCAQDSGERFCATLVRRPDDPNPRCPTRVPN